MGGRLIPLTDRRDGRGQARLAALAGGRLEVGAAGPLVYDSTGTPYLDCAGATLLGHRHPAVVAAVADQLHRRPVASGMLLDPLLAGAAAALAEVTPPGLDFVHFTHDAVAEAVRLARRHGADRVVRPGPAELPAVTGERCCAVLAADSPLLAESVRLCRAYGALVVLDETRTGLGRTGRWWAAAAEVDPDVLCVGGSLSGGVVPVEAIATAAHLLHAYEPATPATPIALAAATAALRAIRDDRLLERAALLGAGLLADLAGLVENPGVAGVRGAGLLIDIDCASAEVAQRYALALLDHQVLAATTGATVHLAPPATLTEPHLAWLLGAAVLLGR